MSFSQEIKSWLPGFTRAQKAAMLGVKVSAFDAWCDGRIPDHVEMIRKLMAYVSKDQKNGREDNQP